MQIVSLEEGKITLDGQCYNFQVYLPKKSAKTSGLWRMLRINDLKGNEIITIYNVVKDNLRNIILTSLRDRNLILSGARE